MSDGLRAMLTVFAAFSMVIFGLTVITDTGYDKAIEWFLFTAPLMIMFGVVTEGFNR